MNTISKFKYYGHHVMSRKLKGRYLENIQTFEIEQIIADTVWIQCIKGTLFSAQNKGKRTQADPDQNNIYDAIHKIGIYHESYATDKH